MLRVGIAMAIPSVRLCVTRLLSIKTAKHFVEILLPPDGPIILVFCHRGSLLNADGFTPNRGAEFKGMRKLGNFLPINRCISEMVLDMAIVAIEVK